METKTNPLSECEVKFAKSGWAFEGWASKFGNTDSLKDTIHQGAYQKTLDSRERPIMMRYEHKSGMLPPGKWLRVEEDSTGLFVEGELTKGMSLANDIKACMEHGTLEGLSIGYRVPSDGFQKKDGGGREIYRIDLVEISIVQNPANSETLITGMKAEIETIESLKEAERFLRDAETFTKSTANFFVSRIKELAGRDAQKVYEDEIAELKARINTDHSTSSIVDLIKNLEV